MLKDARALDFIDPNQSRAFKYLEIFKASKQQTKEHQRFIRQLWHGFMEWQRNYHGPHRELFCNPYLEFQYEYLLIDLMEELCRVVDAARDIFEAGGKQLDAMALKFPNEKHPDERDVLTNQECLEEARSFFKYADLEGYRGSPHKL